MMIPARDPKPSQRGHPWKENGWEEKGVCSCYKGIFVCVMIDDHIICIKSLWKRTNLETNLGAPRLLEFPAECPNIFFSFTSTWKKHQPAAETLIFFVKFEEGIEIKIMMIIVKKKSDHKRFLLEGIEDGEGEGGGHRCRLLVPPKGDFSLWFNFYIT